MRVRRFGWKNPTATAKDVRVWALETWPAVENIDEIHEAMKRPEGRDETLLELTGRFDATEVPPTTLAVSGDQRSEALSNIDPALRQSLELAATNIKTVAEAQLDRALNVVTLPEGQQVTTREVPLDAAGVYAPGGRAAYPSSVLMCAIPARVAGVERIALATPPGPTGVVNPVVLAAAELCGVDEVYAIGGAQAIFALVYGTESIAPVNAIAGPGNAWVREAKARVAPFVAIDSLAGPSELMVVVDASSNLEWTALDLCAQAEHGNETTLLAVATDDETLMRLEIETKRAAASRSGVGDSPLALLRVPSLGAAIDVTNAFAPEHLELHLEDPRPFAESVRTAGCVFLGGNSATAFGDYAAGSNHVLPTSTAGRFSGPLGPHVFRRKISTVEVTAEAAAKLAPHVDRIARAEGFPVHGESAMIRTKP